MGAPKKIEVKLSKVYKPTEVNVDRLKQYLQKEPGTKSKAGSI